MTRDPVDVDLDCYLRDIDRREKHHRIKLSEEKMTRTEAISTTTNYLFSLDEKVDDLALRIFEEPWFTDMVCAFIGAKPSDFENLALITQTLFRQKIVDDATLLVDERGGLAMCDHSTKPRNVSAHYERLVDATLGNASK